MRRALSALVLSFFMYEPHAEENVLSGDSLYKSVVQYFEFGVHRTGTRADQNTTSWLYDELTAAGLDVETNEFELLQFFPGDQKFHVEGRRLDVFPHWFPRETSGELRAQVERYEGQDLEGKIAYFPAEMNHPWYAIDPAKLSAQAAESGAVAAVFALPHPSGRIYATNAREPYLQRPLPIPTVVMGEDDEDAILRAIELRQSAVLVSEGEARKTKAANVVARYPAITKEGVPWVVVSTPTSGWFGVAGERGPGVALWLGIAKYVAARGTQVNWLFIATSGHELGFMGLPHSKKELPAANEVVMWLHLGASIATREWKENNGELVPLDRETSQAALYLSTEIPDDVGGLFRQLSTLPVKDIEALGAGQSELFDIHMQGFPAAGFVGAHRYFHTPADTPEVTSAELLDPYGNAMRAFVDFFASGNVERSIQ